MSSPAMVQRAYTAIMHHFVETGRAPHYMELADSLGTSVDAARQLQLDTVAASARGAAFWLAADTDYIEACAPFSNLPTQVLISVDGVQKWYGL